MSNDASQEMPADSSDFHSDRDWIGLSVSLVSVLATAGLFALGWTVPALLTSVVLISVVIWQSCDPFADAAQWIGKRYHIPGSVRGATLDAVSSSLPELFTGIFFVLVALAAVSGDDGVSMMQASGEGLGSTIATCAGSAIYNMVLIPAFCAIVISFTRKSKPYIEVEDQVILRDGLTFLACELVLLFFLYFNELQWWMALVFPVIYAGYVCWLYRTWRVYRSTQRSNQLETETASSDEPNEGEGSEAASEDELEDDEDDGDEAGVLFGFISVPLTVVRAWMVLAISTAVAAAACYFLVEVTRETALELGVPTFFVAVVLAAAASSVPDTFLSIGSARRGDDSGAVSNAFGSNIFDICVCIPVPLVINSALIGFEPVSLLQENGEPIRGLVGLRLMLWTLTLITLGILWHRRQLTRFKGFILVGLYLIFIGYAVAGSLGLFDLIFSA